jgi:two-component system response regulator QseB
VKPFALAELLARLQALARRSSGLTNHLGKTLSIADLQLCASTREVTRNHQPLMLTKMGFTILKKRMQHAPAIVPRRVLPSLRLKHRGRNVDEQSLATPQPS